MSPKLIVASVAVTLAYVIVVALFGFEGFVAVAINFGRVALAAAVLIIYIPALHDIFREVPAPQRDYLLAGIILTWSSGELFAINNEFARIFGITNSVYHNPVSGSFSLLLVLGAWFHLRAPGTGSSLKTVIAIAIGICVGAIVVFVAPLFH